MLSFVIATLHLLSLLFLVPGLNAYTYPPSHGGQNTLWRRRILCKHFSGGFKTMNRWKKEIDIFRCEKLKKQKTNKSRYRSFYSHFKICKHVLFLHPPPLVTCWQTWPSLRSRWSKVSSRILQGKKSMLCWVNHHRRTSKTPWGTSCFLGRPHQS